MFVRSGKNIGFQQWYEISDDDQFKVDDNGESLKWLR